MVRRLQGKVIVVAGGGGIGGGLAKRYAGEGASVVLGDISEAVARETVDEITAAGGTATALQLDGSDDASIKAAVDLAVSSYGGLDGFHANFANFGDGNSPVDVLDLPMDIYDEVMHVNARGFVLCTQRALPPMLERGGGSIVYTSSGSAHQPMASRTAYSMGKAAGHALMRHVATKFGPRGIRANTIAPGVIAHKRFWEVMDPKIVDEFKAIIPIGRLGAPEDIAAMGALLMSDEGSFITGQVISVDGGASMRP